MLLFSVRRRRVADAPPQLDENEQRKLAVMLHETDP
jgi:hypothetical protein